MSTMVTEARDKIIELTKKAISLHPQPTLPTAGNRQTPSGLPSNITPNSCMGPSPNY